MTFQSGHHEWHCPVLCARIGWRPGIEQEGNDGAVVTTDAGRLARDGCGGEGGVVGLSQALTGAAGCGGVLGADEARDLLVQRVGQAEEGVGGGRAAVGSVRVDVRIVVAAAGVGLLGARGRLCCS